MTFGSLRSVALCAAVIAGCAAHAEATSQTTPANPPPGAAKPDVATLLFATPQWGQAPVGSAITYAYAKKTSDASMGTSFDDHITLELGAGEDASSRTTEVKMFSGTHAVPAGPFKSDQQNPVLLLVFEDNVQELSKSFQANPRYFKNAIRKAWRDNAKIEPVQVAVDGKSVPGTRVTVQPFLNDPQASRMKGLDGMVYTVDVAEGVPGNIAAIDIHAPAVGNQTFSETLRYAALKTTP